MELAKVTAEGLLSMALLLIFEFVIPVDMLLTDLDQMLLRDNLTDVVNLLVVRFELLDVVPDLADITICNQV